MSTPFNRISDLATGVAPSAPQAPAADAPPPTGLVTRALSVFRKTAVTEAANETDATGLDPVQAALALAADRTERSAPVSLAEQLLDYVTPHPRRPLNLTASRIITLLDIAAGHVSRGASESDEIRHLGAEALEQELRAHRALAERRATLLGPAVSDASEAPDAT